MNRPFRVVIPREDGGVEVHRMKEWLRRHPDRVPPGLDPTGSTSYQLRNALRGMGWHVEETAKEVRLVPPGVDPPPPDVVVVEDDEDQDEPTAPAESEAAFGLESQMRDFMAQNMESLAVNGRKLRLYVDPAGRDGVEYPTDVGPIDLLAVDEAGSLVVFELKRARVADRAIGQLARYMGWVRQTIGRGRPVHGVIVAKQISDQLRYAASVVPNVSLFEYEVEFRLRPADGLGPPLA